MEETHICVLDRDGAIVHQGKAASTTAAIEAELAKAPICRRVVFETGRMAPMLYLAWPNGVGLPRALSPDFIEQAPQESEGIEGLCAGMHGLVTASAAVLSAVSVIFDASPRTPMLSCEAQLRQL